MTRIFSKLECDCSVIEDTLGSSTGISDNNIMSYMGLVEQRTNELLTIQAFLTSKVTSGSLLLFLPCVILVLKAPRSSFYRIWKRTTTRETLPNTFWVKIQNCSSRTLASSLQPTSGRFTCSLQASVYISAL